MKDPITRPTENHPRAGEPVRERGDPAVLIAEANHRIANNLSAVIGLIHMQAAALAAKPSMSGAEIRFVLEEIAARIDAIGMLHKRLAQKPLERDLDLADYLRDVCESLTLLAQGADMKLIQDFAADCRISRDRIVPLALVVNELVVNATKYAHPAGAPGVIRISCHQDGGGNVIVEVTDDGVGLPEEFDPKSDGNVGLRLVRKLAEQMEAELAFTSSSLGVSVRLVVPLTER